MRGDVWECDGGTGAFIIIGQEVEPIGEDSTFSREIPLPRPSEAVRAQSFGQHPSMRAPEGLMIEGAQW